MKIGKFGFLLLSIYTNMLIKAIAVFCSSQPGNNDSFTKHAIGLGKILANKNIKLVYGGGNVGLMGCVANAALECGGDVIGVIPRILDKRERSHRGLTELLVVDDMHIRKKKMYELCDAAIILPGGYGTLDELFEMITWNNLNIHDKHIFILNCDGYYNHLLAHFQMMMEQGFLYANPMERITVVKQSDELLNYL